MRGLNQHPARLALSDLPLPGYQPLGSGHAICAGRS